MRCPIFDSYMNDSCVQLEDVEAFFEQKPVDRLVGDKTITLWLVDDTNGDCWEETYTKAQILNSIDDDFQYFDGDTFIHDSKSNVAFWNFNAADAHLWNNLP